jgi:phage tail protein X
MITRTAPSAVGHGKPCWKFVLYGRISGQTRACTAVDAGLAAVEEQLRKIMAHPPSQQPTRQMPEPRGAEA